MIGQLGRPVQGIRLHGKGQALDAQIIDDNAARLRDAIDRLTADLNMFGPTAPNAMGFGAKGNGVSDDTTALRTMIDQGAALASANGGMVFCPPGNYSLTGNPFYNRIGQGNCTLTVWLSGAVWTTTKQIKVPASTIIQGTNRLRCGIQAAATFVPSAAISTIALVSNVVTVTTTTAHGLESNATVVIQGVVTETEFNGGWLVTSTPTTTSFTFALTHANANDSTGTVYIPLVVLGDNATNTQGVRLENLQVNAADLVNSVGVYANAIGEQCGGRNLLITQCYKYGIWLEKHGSSAATGGPNNYFFQHIETGVTPNVSGVGVYLRGTAALHRGFDNVTTNTSTNTGTSAAGFDVSGCPGLYSRIHCEHATDGFLIGNRGLASSIGSGRDSASITVDNITGEQSITNLVHIKNFAEVHDIIVLGAAAYLATNVLVDDKTGITLAAAGVGDDYLAWYFLGGLSSGTRISSSPNVPWLIGQAATFATTVTQGSSGLAATLDKVMNAAAGQNREVLWQSGGSLRWIERVDSTAETGADAGSNWSLLARTDAGAAIDQPFFLFRAAGGAFLLSRPLSLAALLSRYNNVNTVGWGVPAIYGQGRSTAQTGDVATVATYTVGAADGSFLISCNMNVTAFTAGTQSVRCDYTDETNTARTFVFTLSSIAGVLGVTVGAVGAFEGLPVQIRCKAATSITVKTVGTVWTGTYNVEGYITQIG